MKNLSKLFAMALALIMTMALTVPAMAAEITITNAVEGQTYSAYKIFDVTKSGDDSYAYTISTSNNWFEAVQTYANDPDKELDLTPVQGDSTKYNVSITEDLSEEEQEAFAKDFAIYLNNNKSNKPVTEDVVASSENATITVTEPGYYFVDSSLGAVCALLTTDSEFTLVEKNQEPTIDKTIVGSGNNNTAKVGDPIPYQIVVTAGGAADTAYVVHDRMSSGLDLDQDSFKIKVNDVDVPAENYEIEFAPDFTSDLADCPYYDSEATTTDCTFEITFNQTYTSALTAGTQIVITYTATLNEDAVIGTDPNTNEAILDYGNTSTPTETTNTYSYSFDLVKTDGENKVLTGAKFKLYDAETNGNEIKVVKIANGEYRVAMADETGVEIEAGQATISGLANGTYWLEETAAPAGYNMLESRVSITIENANNDATVTDNQDGTFTYVSGGLKVENLPGQLLPSTGGMGTTIFYTLGGVLVVAAGVLLVTKKRMHDMEG